MVFKKLILLCAVLTLSTAVHARPYPDKVGVCYEFKGDTPSKMDTCIISITDGAGGTSTTLRLLNKRYDIEGIETANSVDRYGYKYTVNGVSAKSYYRNASFYDIADPEVLFENDEPALYCFKTSSLDLCHN